MLKRHSLQNRPRVTLLGEALEVRALMAADVAFGPQPRASIVAAGQAAAEVGFPRFESEAQLQQILLDSAVERYKGLFGQPGRNYYWNGGNGSTVYYLDSFVGPRVVFSNAGYRDHSNTNVQVDGVDEGDIVKTDGNFIYFLDDRALVIVDTHAAAAIQVLSRTELDGTPSAMYLAGNRLIVLSQQYPWYYDEGPILLAGSAGNASGPKPFDTSTLSGSKLNVSVFDISDRHAPVLVNKTTLEGNLVQSRLIEDQLYLVTQNEMHLPGPMLLHETGEAPTSTGTFNLVVGDAGGQSIFAPGPVQPPGTYETEAQFRARVAGTLLDSVLPNYIRFDAAGDATGSGRLVAAENLYDRDINTYSNLVSVLVFDVDAAEPALVSSSAVPARSASELYVSLSSVYVIEANYAAGEPVTDIYRFAIGPGAPVTLASIGEVPGRTINQFSFDEYNGYLRVATERGFGESATSGVYVLESVGLDLRMVGKLENLALGERLFTSRFVGERGFLVTFGATAPEPGSGEHRINPPNWVDPLFAIDLSDPANPQLKGQLEIPGFSNYLQVIDDHYLIGFGRKADTTTGAWKSPQVSLFDVADLEHPQLVGRFEMPLGESSWSDAFSDHHAISYFAEHHVLAIPMNTSRLETIVDGNATRYESRTYSQLWVFKVDPSATSPVESLGQVDLRTPLHRSLRIEDELYSIADSSIQAAKLTDPGTQLGEVYFGPLAFDIQYNVDKSAVNQPLDVLGNFSLPAFVRDGLRLVGVTAGEQGGSVSLAANGASVLYTPPADFVARNDSFTFTVMDSKGRTQQATARVQISWASYYQRMHDLAVADLAARLGVAPGSILDDSDGWYLWRGQQSERIWQDTALETPLSVQAAVETPTAGYEFRLNYNGSRFTYRTNLGSLVVLSDDQLYVGPDEFVLAENSMNNVLGVTANDYPGVRRYRSPEITEVTASLHGGSVRVSDDGLSLIYSPAARFVGVDKLTYTLADGATGTVKVRMPWVRLGDRMVELARQDLADVLQVSVDEIGVSSFTERIAENNLLSHRVSGVAYKNEWTIGFEIHLTYHGLDVEYASDVDQAVELSYAPGLVRPDSFTVNAQSSGNQLSVQNNDFPGAGYDARPLIDSVSQGSAGGTVSIGLYGRTVLYSPPLGYTGEDTFTYTVGGQTTTAKVSVAPLEHLAEFRVIVNDAFGAAKPFEVGDQIRVNIYANDLRGGEVGFSSASLNLLFNPAQARLMGPIVYGYKLVTDAEPLMQQPGRIDSVRVRNLEGHLLAFGQYSTNQLLLTATFKVLASGPLTFTVESLGSGMQLFGRGDQTLAGDPADVTTVIQIAEALQQPGQSAAEDIDNDRFVTPRDALLLIDYFNANGARRVNPSLGGTASALGFGMHLAPRTSYDVNGSGDVNLLDVLQVIDRLHGAISSSRAAAPAQATMSSAADDPGGDVAAALTNVQVPATALAVRATDARTGNDRSSLAARPTLSVADAATRTTDIGRIQRAVVRHDAAFEDLATIDAPFFDFGTIFERASLS